MGPAHRRGPSIKDVRIFLEQLANAPPHDLVLRPFQVRVPGQQVLGRPLGGAKQPHIGVEAVQPQGGQTVLSLAEEVAGAPAIWKPSVVAQRVFNRALVSGFCVFDTKTQ